MEQDKWISVDLKKPDEEGSCLVWMPRLEEEAVIRNWNLDCWYDERAGEDISEDVTYWQKLPSPPINK